jgi:hypothetical protein
MRTYQAASVTGTVYCVERRAGPVCIVTPHAFMTLQVMDALRG